MRWDGTPAPWGRGTGGYLRLRAALALAGSLVVAAILAADGMAARMAHQRACAADSGIRVHLDPAAWVQANGPVRPRASVPGSAHITPLGDGWERSWLNDRVAQDDRQQAVGDAGTGLHRSEFRVVDVETDEVLVTMRDYWVAPAHPDSGWTAWLRPASCARAGLAQDFIEQVSPLRLWAEVSPVALLNRENSAVPPRGGNR